MPHVVIEEVGDLEGLFQTFAPIIQQEALLESIAIEQAAACNFFVQLKLHEKAITVRPWPATDAEKTPAVKVMALMAGFIRKVYPGSRYGKTNLQEYLKTTTDSI